ncbi:hypothetical protein Hanom_Chr04g00314401 [Helianthus anomalus]
MALTWATRVRFGRATRRNDRVAANRLGSSSEPKNAYFHELFYVLCFLVGFLDFYFVLVFGPSVF